MSYKVEQIPGTGLTQLGEGPHWDIKTQSLYYVDINKGRCHRYSYKEQKEYITKIESEEIVSFIIPVKCEKNHFACGLGRRVGIISWDGKSSTAKVVRIAFEVEQEKIYKDNRFNDAKADPHGNFVGGTMRKKLDVDIFDYRLGSLYSTRKRHKVKQLLCEIGCSNGLTWNIRKKRFYYIDSVALNIRSFEYDFEKARILDTGRIIIDFTDDNGRRPDFIPDGMTIDSEGYLYVATFGASKIFVIHPEKCRIISTINFPCEKITSCAFGGPNLDILYVTSAATRKDSNDESPPAGAVFQVTGLQAKGLPMQKVRLFSVYILLFSLICITKEK